MDVRYWPVMQARRGRFVPVEWQGQIAWLWEPEEES
jgi:hypothetical protein